jgi:hypothetical protein
MLKYLLVVAGLALMAFGGHGLYQASLNPPPQGAPDVLIFSVSLGAGLAILVASLWLLRRPPAPPPVVTSPDDRAEVIERLYKHTEALRAAVDGPPAPGPDIESGIHTAPDAEVVLAAEEEVAKAKEEIANGEGRKAKSDIFLPSIMLLDVGRDAGLEQIESAPPLGTRAEVLARLRDVLPDLELGPDGRATHTGPDHTVTFDAGADDVVHTLVIEASGRTGVSLVRWLMEGTGWRGFVPKRGSFVDPEGLEELAAR